MKNFWKYLFGTNSYRTMHRALRLRRKFVKDAKREYIIEKWPDNKHYTNPYYVMKRDGNVGGLVKICTDYHEAVAVCNILREEYIDELIQRMKYPGNPYRIY